MSFGTGRCVLVMAAERYLNFVQGGDTLVARLSIPEQDEPLSANATVGFRVSFGDLAEYLHSSTSRRDEAYLVP